MAADLGRLVATLEARAEKFDLTIQRATDRLDTIASKTEAANHRIARSTASLDQIATRAAKGFAVLGTALAAAGTAVAYFAVRQVQALDKLGDLSKQTGLTATELRQLQVGLELNGGRAEQAGEGMLTFSRNLGQVEAGTGRLTALLKKLDPAFLASLRTAGSTGEALRLMADRIAVARSEQEKLAIATAAFGGAGREFVLLLADGARGVDALGKRLEALGIGNLDEVTAAAQRFDDQLKLLKGAVTTGFQQGLFGVGDGLDTISDALDDETIKNLGAFAKGMGEIVAAMTSVSADVLASWGEFFRLRGEGAGFGESLGVAGQSLDVLNDRLEESTSRLAELQSALEELGDTGGALPEPAGAFDLEARSRRGEIEAIRREREELLREQGRLRAAIQSRQPFVGPELPPSSGRTPPDLSGLDGPGSRGLDKAAESARKKVEAEREKLLQGQETFVESMRQSSLGALTEAQGLSLKLAETLGKIGEAAQAGTLSTTEAIEFQTAAIEEATAAMEAAGARADAIRAKAQGGVQLDILKAEAGVEADSFGGLSQALERELAKAEAIVEKSALDEKIREAYAGGDPAALEAALARNQQILEDKIADIESNWDETLGSIGEIGKQTLDDFFRGIAEGSDAGFADMAKAFLLRLAEMEAAAIAADLTGALSGKGGDPTSITGQVIGKVLGGEGGDDEDAAKAEKAGETISGQLLDALADGSGYLVDAGISAGEALANSAGSLLDAGLQAAAAIFEAAAQAAAASASTALLAFGGGGAVTPRGAVRLERIHALAEGAGAAGSVRVLTGEAGTERLLSLDEVAKIATASGGDSGRASAMAQQVGQRLDRPEIRDLAAGDIVIPDRKMRGFFDRIMPRARLAEGGFSALDSFAPLDSGAGRGGFGGLGGALTIKVEQHVAPDVKAGPLKASRGPSGEIILQQAFTRAFARDMSVNGPMAQRIAPEGPQGGLR